MQNWFQNRRAKRKQEKKQEAYEAGQAQEALQYSEPSSPEFFSHGNSYFDGQPMPMAQSSSSFAMASGPPPAVASYNPQYSDPSTASMESLHRTLAVAHAAEHDDFQGFVDQQDFSGSLPHDFSTSDRVQFPSPEQHSLPHFDDNQTYTSFTPHFSTGLYNEGQPLEVETPEETSDQTPTSFENTFSPQTAPAPQLMTTFPSQLLPTQSHDGLPRTTEEQNDDSSSPEADSATSIGFKFDISESDTMSPPSSVPFKSPPPPSDIASRRKKVQVKPAALVAETLRTGRPSMGPRTVSHADGFRRPVESPIGSPMRRIASAGGNRNVLNGRVFKSGVESAQRSPIYFGTFESAGAFMEQNYHNIRNPSLTTASSSLNSSLAPPTPMSPRGEMTFLKHDDNRSTASPVQNFVFDAGSGGFTTMEGDHSLSPPETPQAPMAINVPANWVQTLDFSEKQWQFEVPDEPLYTPALDTFPMELHMPQPSYLNSMSQPVTPAFGQFNPNFMFGNESPQFTESPKYTLSTQTGSEYSFPDASPHYVGLSPTMTKQKTFQFSHTTAADFSEKRE